MNVEVVVACRYISIDDKADNLSEIQSNRTGLSGCYRDDLLIKTVNISTTVEPVYNGHPWDRAKWLWLL